jgi:AcrR family transcriptional regulator
VTAPNRAKAKKKPAEEPHSRLDDARTRMYRDLVFESAECVFGEKGFEHATMQDIAGEAGISLKTLYAAFPGKQELYEEIQHVRGQAFIDHVAAAVDPEAKPEARLEHLTHAYVNFLFEHRDWLRIHLQNRQSWGLRPSTEYAAGYWEQGLARTAQLLRDGAKSGCFYDADPMSAAALTQAVMQVQVAQAVARGETDADRTAAEIMLQLRRLLCPPR